MKAILYRYEHIAWICYTMIIAPRRGSDSIKYGPANISLDTIACKVFVLVMGSNCLIDGLDL